MNISNNRFRWTGLVLSLLVLTACEKYEITTPPAQAHFTNRSSASFQVTSTTTKFTVPIGVTTVADVDRTITVNIASPTGATAGREYTVTGNPVVIKAGQAIGSIDINGILGAYTTGRRDTLVMTLSSNDVAASDYNNTFRLAMRGPCFDGDITDVELQALRGAYNNTRDLPLPSGDPYGPYVSRVVSVTRLSPTTARAVIDNVWDVAVGNTNWILDWTDPLNTVVRIDGTQATTVAAGLVGFPQFNYLLRDNPGEAARKFSVCTSTINLSYRIGLWNPANNAVVGFFDANYTEMKR